MTGDEYLVKRIIELEAEIKSLKDDKMIYFVFGTYYNLKPLTYEVKIVKDNVSVEKVEK